MTTQQLAIDFTPGLLEQYETLLEVMRADVLVSGRMQKAIAADCDMSPSEFARRLSDDDIPFRMRDFERFLKATGGKLTLQWLVLKYLGPNDSPAERAARDLTSMVPLFLALAKTAGVVLPTVAK